MGRSMCTVYDESVTHEECDSQTTPNDGRGPTDRSTDRPIDRSIGLHDLDERLFG